MSSVHCLKTLLLACAVAAGMSYPCFAANKWWPVKVMDASSGKDVPIDYVPGEKASKAYTACVLIPHLKDAAWVSMTYGLETEIRRQGLNMTLYEAGGYENLPKQLSQFDDCMASQPDIMIVAPISEAGLTQKLKEAKAKGVPVVIWINPVMAGDLVTAKVFADYGDVGEIAGKATAQMFKGKPANVVLFPGPAGSGWAENTADGFKRGSKDSSVKVLDEKFGDTGVSIQLQLIQDALQTYPDMNLIYGPSPTAEAAIGAVAQAGRQDQVKIFSAFPNTAIIDALRRGDVMAVGSEMHALMGRIAADQAVRILDKKPYIAYVKPIPIVLTKDNLGTVDMDQVISPPGWQPVFTIKQN
jgi:periplasmic protein TorT